MRAERVSDALRLRARRDRYCWLTTASGDALHFCGWAAPAGRNDDEIRRAVCGTRTLYFDPSGYEAGTLERCASCCRVLEVPRGRGNRP